MNTYPIPAILVAGILLFSGCVQKPKEVETRLYFGLSKPDGSLVSDSSWRQFEREEILRLFPQGFTVLSAQGVWKGSTGLVEESSKVVVFVHPESDTLSSQIDTLRKRYKDQFSQDAVLRTDEGLKDIEF